MKTTTTAAAAFCALAACSSARAQLGISPGPTRAKPEIVTAPPIVWVESFAAARVQAKRLGRPVFVFIRDGLKGSRLMEVGTVNTPDVQKRAQHFVCVQLDPQKEVETGALLKIATSQGVIVADADGKVLQRLEGNPVPEAIVTAMDAALKAFGPVPSDADLAALDQMLARARQHAQAKRAGSALRMLERMIRTGAKCESVLQAKALVDEIAAAGAGEIAEAKAQLEKGAGAAVLARLRTLAAEYAGTEAGNQARDLLAQAQKAPTAGPAPQDTARVEALWGMVKAASSRGRLDDERDALEKIVAAGTETDRQKAEARLAQIADDPELKEKLDWQLKDREARALLARGAMWLRTEPERGKKILSDLIQQYPETDAAAAAKDLLAGD